MAYWAVESEAISVSGQSCKSVTYNAGGGTTLLSIGWQNQGNAQSLNVTQAFIYNNGANAYIQYVNNASTSITVNTWIVCTNSAGSEDEANTANVAARGEIKMESSQETALPAKS